MAVRNRVCGPTQCGIIASTTRQTVYAGSKLKPPTTRAGAAWKPALQPYWGKPAVRNDRGIEETSASFEARSAPRSYPTLISGSCLSFPVAECGT